MEKNIEVSEESGVEEITREQAYYIMGIDREPIKYRKIRADICFMHDEKEVPYIEILRDIYLDMKEEFAGSLKTEGERS